MGSSAGTSTAVHVHPSGPLLSLRQRWQLLAVSGPGRSSVWPSAENEPGCRERAARYLGGAGGGAGGTGRVFLLSSSTWRVLGVRSGLCS